MMLSCFVALSVSLTLKGLPLQDKGNIVKQNRFVRNMASVLRINPERIRVTNIVPGNRRRLQEPASCTAAGAVEQSVCDAALVYAVKERGLLARVPMGVIQKRFDGDGDGYAARLGGGDCRGELGLFGG